METLTEDVWDLVIAGTSLPQSLLALSLSRSDKKILHVDLNNYYGGNDAGFSLQDAEHWVQSVKDGSSRVFSNPSIEQHPDESGLKSSRSYTLSLNPQIIYAQSSFLPALVSSQINTQLEFLAVGSWWILRDGNLRKIPSTREDVFSDETLSMRDKRSLMRFLRSVLQPEDTDQPDNPALEPGTLKQALQEKYNIPPSLHSPIQALALAQANSDDMDFDTALQRIRRHMRSIGYFGPGFGAVIAKYGGNAEIAQVACRAQAVGGGVYLLGHGIETIGEDDDAENEKLLHVKLTDGTLVRSHRVVGGIDDLPQNASQSTGDEDDGGVLHSVNIVSDPMTRLFPPTSENGPVPAAAIVLVESQNEEEASPIYLQVHSEDSGECPSNQCIIYASMKARPQTMPELLCNAIDDFLKSFEGSPKLLWTLSYTSRCSAPPPPTQAFNIMDSQSQSTVTTLPARLFDIALDDSILEDVKQIWTRIIDADAGAQEFLRFEDREPHHEDNLT